MKKILIVMVIIVALFSLTGCALDYGEMKGTVVDMKYTSSFMTTSMIYSGKTMIPTTQYYPESWRIKIQKEEDRHNKNNLVGCIRGNI